MLQSSIGQRTPEHLDGMLSEHTPCTRPARVERAIFSGGEAGRYWRRSWIQTRSNSRENRVARAIAIDIDIEGRIIVLLRELHIANEAELP